MTEFEKVNEETIADLSELASAIVKEHYDPILGNEQNDYMIEKFQSPRSLLFRIMTNIMTLFLLILSYYFCTHCNLFPPLL